MAIDPNLTETVIIPNLPDLALVISNLFAHSAPNGTLGKINIQGLANFITPYVAAIGASGYLPTSGTTLPTTSVSTAYTIVQAGIYTQASGGDVIATGTLNIISWNGTIWALTSAIDVTMTDYLSLIEYHKNPFSIPGENKFDPNTVIHGYSVLFHNGDLYPNNEYSASVFIPVIGGQQYKINPNIYQELAFYTYGQVYVSGIRISPYNGSFQVPSNASFIRMTTQNGDETAQYLKVDINNNSISREKLTFDNAPVQKSINLFDKQRVTLGMYANYSNGNLEPLSAFMASDLIQILPSTQYTLSYLGNVTGDQMPFYDTYGRYLSGIPSATTFTTPSNAGYLRVNADKSKIDALMLNLGDTIPNYESGAISISKENVRFSTVRSDRVINVGKVGGDYQYIQDAVNNSNGTVDAPQTIVIHPGIYEGTINTVGRFVSLIGVNKRDCIILTQSGNYTKPPLECAGALYCENLTFKATSDVPDSHTLYAYAVHMDFFGSGVTEFYNCIMESHQNAAMGIGLHQNQTLIINSCELIKKSNGHVVDGGSLYFHNSPYDGESGQKLLVTNSKITTDLGASLVIDDAAENAGHIDVDTTVSFINNMFYSDEFGKGTSSYRMSNAPVSGGISGKIKLTPESFGNNIPIINA